MITIHSALDMDELENLNSDFIKNVLPFLFGRKELPPIFNFSSGQSPGSYSFKLDIEDLLNCAPEYKSTSNSFVHFTSLSALNSICIEQGLRLYNLLNVNDPKEFKMFASIFGFNEFQIESYKGRIHVCSFCDSKVLESDEILTYWRSYGLDGYGCAIEFEIQDPIKRVSHVKLANILYSKPDFSNFLKANSEFEQRNRRTTDLKELVHLQACLHKDPIYKMETEVRLLFEDGFAEPHLVCEEGYPFGFDINRKGKIVSYYKVRFYDEKIGYPLIKIKRIQFGYNITLKDAKKYEDYLSMVIISMSKNLGVHIDLPVFEVSPLIDKFQ